AVLDLLRARTRRFEIVFLFGLEEGRLPRRGHESPFLADDARRDLDERSRARLMRPDQVARDRYLFYTACTRATQRVYLVREAARLDRAPGALPVLLGAAQGARGRPCRRRPCRRRRRLPAPLPGRGGRGCPHGAHRAPAARAPPWPLARPGGFRPGGCRRRA